MERVFKNYYVDHSLLHNSKIEKRILCEALRKFGASQKTIHFRGFEISIENGKKGDVLIKNIRQVH